MSSDGVSRNKILEYTDRLSDEEAKRDYLTEAVAILKGTTMMLPQREHLIALEENWQWRVYGLR